MSAVVHGRPQIALDSGERPAGLRRRRSPPLAGATQETGTRHGVRKMDGKWLFSVVVEVEEICCDMLRSVEICCDML